MIKMSIQLTTRKALFFILFLFIGSITVARAAPGRWEKKVSGNNWRLWLDRNAEWLNDEIFLPTLNISQLPVNPPTCGWDNHDLMNGKKVSVPGTVEEYYWGANENIVGTSGDYRGVSWWSTTFQLDPALKSKKIIIAFESVNLRAEVLVNKKLVGYDVIGNTPFEVDATSAVSFTGENRLDIRITDPGGNFSWPAHTIFKWGKYNIPIVRGFGGITGDITIRAIDAVYVNDIYVQNKKKIKEVEIFIKLVNDSGTTKDGKLTLTIHEYNHPSKVIWKKMVSQEIPPGGKECSIYVKEPKAKTWGILDPHLYIASVTFKSSDGTIEDTMKRRFGFRWFDIGEKNGDKRLYLNGKRVFLMSTVNRGYWPTNGMYASPEMARKDVETAISMGYNSIAFHNAISQPQLIRFADEYGLVCSGESGGYRINDSNRKPCPDKITRDLRREKLFRFIKRDRSYPSIVIYMLKNEDQNPPDEDDLKNMAKIRELDPTRILLYNGDRDRRKPAYENDPNDPLKLFFKPLDPKKHNHGWWDMHHWNPHAGYMDFYYNNPRNYMRYNIVDGDSTHPIQKDEVIFYSEEGAFGTMLRLGMIKQEIDRQGTSDGWREKEHLDWFHAYDRFLDESGFRTSFPTVDHLTLTLGENMHYFHGRIVENARISNIIDAYCLNGWASAATHTDMVDVYRYPTGDPSILKYYNQPLYVAVKIRDKVIPIGFKPIADIFIANEANLNGRYTLELKLKNPFGNPVFSKTFPVIIKGGEEYGQLLVEGVNLPEVSCHGYFRLEARIISKKRIECTGFDEIFAVDFKSGSGIKGNGAMVDSKGVINNLLKEARGITFPEFTAKSLQMDYIIVGTHNFEQILTTLYNPIMEQVVNGATLIVIEHADRWANQLDGVYGFQALQYNGSAHWGNRGRLFVGKSKLLTDLPISQSMSWEYQVFYKGDVWGLKLNHTSNETVVALAAQNRKDILCAVSRIPHGNGQIILSTLTMMPELESKTPQSAIAKKLFLNFLEYAGEERY